MNVIIDDVIESWADARWAPASAITASPTGWYGRCPARMRAMTQPPPDPTSRAIDPTRGSLRRRFARGVSWNMLGTMFAQGSVLATNILVANRLGLHSFGELSMLLTTALTASAVAQVATGATATRYVAQYRANDPGRAGRILGSCAVFTVLTGLAACLFVLTFSEWLSANAMNAPHLGNSLKIMSLYLLFSAMSGYQSGALAGLEGYRSLAGVSALHAIVHLSLVAIGASIWGLTGVLWSMVVSVAVRWALFHRAIEIEARGFGIRISYGLRRDERDVLLRFALPAALSGVVTMVAIWLSNTFVARRPTGFSEIALFTAALNLKTIVMLVSTMVGSVGGVLVQSHASEPNRARFRKAYFFNVASSAAAVVGAGLVIILMSGLLLSTFGNGFTAAKPLVAVLLVGAFLETVTLALYQLVYSLERMWWSFFAIGLPKDLTFLGAALFLIPWLGISGLAWAYVLSWIVALFAVVIFVGLNRGQLWRSYGGPSTDG